MHELKVTVSKVMGRCTADPPMKRGDYFTVRDGDIRIPEGGYICMWALQSLLTVIPLKERKILAEPSEDWVWRVHHVQCPDPEGRVIFKIEQETEREREIGIEREREREIEDGMVKDLRVVVEEVKGKCTSGMGPGDYFVLRSGHLTIPAGRHFCLYALHAVLPLLPAKQRPLDNGDWLKDDAHVICPDPAGNVVMRIEQI